MDLLILPILFLSGLTFGVTGFGSALVAMPLLTPLLGVETAAPMFALIAVVAEAVTLIRYRRHIQFTMVWRLMLASLIALPIGMTLAGALPERAVLLILGSVVAGYALYRLLKLPLPEVKHPALAFPFGFLGGLLSGAYNTGGPPIVIYGTLMRWTPTQFKSSLQGLFITNSIVVVTLHLLRGTITQPIVEGAAIGLPLMLIGIGVGWLLERRIDPARFQTVVLIVLVLVGARLVVGNLG